MTVERLRHQLHTVTSPTTKKAILVQIERAKDGEKEDQLRYDIRHCRRCGLNRTRSHAVPYSGPPRGRADLMLVGEAPGQSEDSKGIPFVGQSGKLLDHALTQAGTNRDKCFVVNTLCCRPPNNRDPRPNELKAYRSNFEAQLEMGDCAVGVTLGAYALANVAGLSRKNVSMAKNVDKPLWIDGRIWIPAYHPAYILRNRKDFSTFVKTLQLALAIRWGEDRPLPTPIWDQVEIDGTKGTTIEGSIKKKGYAFLYSRTLGTQIVVLEHEGKKVPPALEHLPRYSLDELIRVGLMGKGRRAGWTRQALRNLNMVKHEFGGTVIQG